MTASDAQRSRRDGIYLPVSQPFFMRRFAYYIKKGGYRARGVFQIFKPLSNRFFSRVASRSFEKGVAAIFGCFSAFYCPINRAARFLLLWLRVICRQKSRFLSKYNKVHVDSRKSAALGKARFGASLLIRGKRLV